MKRLLSTMLALSMIVSLTACSGGSAAPTSKAPASAAPSETASSASADQGTASVPDASKDPKVTLTYAEVNPDTSLMGLTDKEFKADVEKLSGGSIQINLQCSGVLGAEGDVLDTIIGGGGAIDMARLSTFSLTNYGTKFTSLLSVPYTFKDRDSFWKFAASDLGQKVLNEPEDKGLKLHGLFFAEEGFRSFFFKSKVSGINDLKGKKIRVSTDPIMTGMVKNLGASPTVVAFTELYSALSSGVVDAAEQPIVEYASNKFNEVASYVLMDQHTLGSSEIVITDAAWAKMTDAQKACVKEASTEASKYNHQQSQKEEDSTAKMKAAGVTFIPVNDISVWQNACKSTIDSATKGQEDNYKAILAFSK